MTRRRPLAPVAAALAALALALTTTAGATAHWTHDFTDQGGAGIVRLDAVNEQVRFEPADGSDPVTFEDVDWTHQEGTVVLSAREEAASIAGVFRLETGDFAAVAETPGGRYALRRVAAPSPPPIPTCVFLLGSYICVL